MAEEIGKLDFYKRIHHIKLIYKTLPPGVFATIAYFLFRFLTAVDYYLFVTTINENRL
ncbi:MAG: hypothetical protein ABL903_18185 [Methylococcales bacterium]